MRLRGSRWLAVVTTIACLTVGACHHGVGQEAAETGYNGEVTLRVVNHSYLDVTVYLQQGTRRDRIGTATATTTTEFRVALRRLTSGGDYRLLGDPIGSRQAVRSESLHAQDGDVVIWTLEDDLARSFVEVR
ncbi:MAG TPA: hypothetical protein VGH98_21345 [Gemmatimonadaceae bacterium]